MKTAYSILACAVLLLAGCKTSNNITINQGSIAAAQTKSRSEPIFYNGKTYRLDYSYMQSSKAFDMRVSGMGPKQQKDAVAVATSGLRYFACTDSQSSQMIGGPSYAGGVWNVQARCV
ncbi:MAG: hypothetical protein ACREDX_10630 [Aestuariivirga sp.]